jgi:hypothetical protein
MSSIDLAWYICSGRYNNVTEQRSRVVKRFVKVVSCIYDQSLTTNGVATIEPKLLVVLLHCQDRLEAAGD